jgi:hypothetical protein
MKTFVIFDRKTGEILQTHVESGDLHTGPEGLLKTARPEAKPDAVGVMEVEALTPGVSYRVDVKAKRLVQAEGGTARGGAGAFVQPVGGDYHAARHVIVQVEPGKKP